MTKETQKNKLPLEGIKVVEMGSLIAGPFCSRILAEFGAEVIKIEPPKGGDQIRKWRVLDDSGTSLWWYVQSRNKKCITLDCRSEDGLKIVKKLLEDADVLIENFKPGTIAKWGLSKQVLEEINPRLITCHISGYGQDGPYHDRPGYGAIGEAMGGLRHLTGYPELPPTRVGISIGDSVASLYSVIGILLALYNRDNSSGKGQEVDVALYEAIFSLMESMVPEYDVAGVIRERTGSVLPGIVPSNIYKTKDDKFVVLAANGDNIFQRLLVTMKREDMVGDQRFLTNDGRVKHVDYLEQLIKDWVIEYNLDECLEMLNQNGIPAGAIYNVEDIMADPHYQSRNMILELEHSESGKLKMPGIVPKLSKTPGNVKWVGPKLGEHNVEVFKKIGLTQEQINKLYKEGII
ncbi:CaiB/BaiF CoA transferase family protein [Priestia megaterium]|uniref:CaiB/BaiF CoA transferase family protein n=1 Tax=Priestia megaterium TaxID=1404 RepID=UPI000D50C9C2|nr:CaiB/BaiF CoA-transferase family protein [Priestia megaterium]PVE64476.1 formyl-CoA transferase [Priestia megaterium]PVE79858.1 formyl-CoA transferase [Priestia megaterium]PVE83765.1 formyl-CoA transferase [Priestia megaterium]PVE99557.1 formyl-CoA transferase [Priestia megaterium]